MNWRRWYFASSLARWLITALFILVLAALAATGVLP